MTNRPQGAPLAVGDVIHGFASGAFGRDHYDCVRIEAVGPDWIVAREPRSVLGDDGPCFASGRSALESCIEARDRGHVYEDSYCSFESTDRTPLTTWGQS